MTSFGASILFASPFWYWGFNCYRAVSTFVQRQYSTDKEILIPPKPKGVQEVTDGEGDEVLYTEEGA